MPVVELPIWNGAYAARSLPQANQQLINWYIQPTMSGGLSTNTLYGTPGLEQIATTGTNQQVNRGAHVKGGIAYYVNGNALYRLNRTVVDNEDIFSLDSLGTVDGSGRVSMADNGTQLMILVPGGIGYIFDESAGTPFSIITDPDFTANGNPQHVVYIDGYFACTTDSKKFIISALNDGTAWDALDFGTAEADPDSIVAPIVHKNQLFIAGSETFEVYQNIGGSGFPFQRVEGFILPAGVSAPFTLHDHDETFMFVGAGPNDSPQIYAFTGTTAEVISTDAIDEFLRTLTEEEIADAFGFIYAQSGSDFACFTIADRTLVFNMISRKWAERSSHIVSGSTISDTKWRVNSIITAYNRVLVGDAIDGRIGSLDLDLYEEYGSNIIRTLVTLPFANQGNSFFVPYLELTVESGVGDNGTPDPQIRMSRSKDGKTFTDEVSRGLGAVGEYNRRCIWRRLGRAARFELFKFVFSENVKFVIIKLEANIIGGT